MTVYVPILTEDAPGDCQGRRLRPGIAARRRGGLFRFAAIDGEKARRFHPRANGENEPLRRRRQSGFRRLLNDDWTGGWTTDCTATALVTEPATLLATSGITLRHRRSRRFGLLEALVAVLQMLPGSTDADLSQSVVSWR